MRNTLISIGMATGLLLMSVSAPAALENHDLSFEERVVAQGAIERIYHEHRTGASRPFAEAMSGEVLQAKVRKYLFESALLAEYWGRPVTAAMLERELRRIAHDSLYPERLGELFAALGNDPFVIQECLARPLLVDRLTTQLFDADERIHGAARRRAERLRKALVAGTIDPHSEHPLRTVFEIAHARSSDVSPREESVDLLDRVELADTEFALHRAGFPERPGAVGSLMDARRAFVVSIVLEEDAERIQVASFVVPKRSRDEWFAEEFDRRDTTPVVAVASRQVEMPAPTASTKQTWDSPIAARDDDCGSWWDWPPHLARAGHSAVWTGTEMIVWGGSVGTAINIGARYDPATGSWSATSLIDSPSARGDHVAVWTGTEMIVWGGHKNGDGFLDTGGRYDPVRDSWTPTSTSGAPSARRFHTAVWTGMEMVVWGGHAGGYLNTGGRYDPATDSWTPTSVTGGPSARSLHTAVWTETEMIVWGGYDGTSRLATGGRYDPAADSWTATASMGAPAARDEHTAVWTETEMIVWGGFDGATQIDTGGRYDPETDSWTATGSTDAPTPRASHTAVWTETEMIVWGGSDDSFDLDSGARYDPVSNAWTATSAAGAPSARSLHSTVWTGTQMIIWGGIGGSVYLESGSRYDPAADVWQVTEVPYPAAPTARIDHAVVWTGAEMIVWGGWERSAYSDYGARYDPLTDAWSATRGIGAPTARRHHSAVWTGTEMIVWGGLSASPGYLDTGGRYNPGTDSWLSTNTSDAPSARGSHTAVWTDTEMVVWGGTDGSPQDSGGRYDPGTDSWLPTSTSGAPSARTYHTAVWTGTEMIVWGGFDGDYSGAGGRYNPAMDLWSATSTTGSPSARGFHSAVWTDTEMIVWGGHQGSSPLNTGGRYDPATNSWTATSTAEAPSASGQHGAVWTGTEMIVWGGSTGASGSGGRYDPVANDWTATSLVGAPAGRWLHSSVWTGTEMIVWGGSLGFQSYLSTGGRYFPAGDVDGDGWRVCDGDCKDSIDSIFPGAPQICDGINNDCDDPTWPDPPADEIDEDGDLYADCDGDCDDTEGNTYPQAPEINDGLDNQCPGDEGHGLVDEVGGPSGFTNSDEGNEFCWSSQIGATAYQIVRSPYPDFSSDCTSIVSSVTCGLDPAAPPVGGAFYYLVRAIEPHVGSWGEGAPGMERTVPCVGDSYVFSFIDTIHDDLPETALSEFFGTFEPDPGDWILFEIEDLIGPDSWCAPAADWYWSHYLDYAEEPGGLSLSSPGFEKWYRNQASGYSWTGPDFGSYWNCFGQECGAREYEWGSESGLGGGASRRINPKAPWGAAGPHCEAMIGGGVCGDGTWRLTIRIAPTRVEACEF